MAIWCTLGSLVPFVSVWVSLKQRSFLEIPRTNLHSHWSSFLKNLCSPWNWTVFSCSLSIIFHIRFLFTFLLNEQFSPSLFSHKKRKRTKAKMAESVDAKASKAFVLLNVMSSNLSLRNLRHEVHVGDVHFVPRSARRCLRHNEVHVFIAKGKSKCLTCTKVPQSEGNNASK